MRSAQRSPCSVRAAPRARVFAKARGAVAILLDRTLFAVLAHWIRCDRSLVLHLAVGRRACTQADFRRRRPNGGAPVVFCVPRDDTPALGPSASAPLNDRVQR